MRRTTAGINLFRISAKSANPSNKRAKVTVEEEGTADEDTTDEDTTDEEMEWSPEDTRSAISTHTEVMADNAVLRQTNNTIQEKVFDIELDRHLCDMLPDTKLVLVDIPGVNEAGSSDMYMKYVQKEWNSFDCVIVVMDAGQGVNTEEQVKLLEFVRDNAKEQRNIPVIILGNKVDNPDEEEVMELVGEVKSKVEQLFQLKKSSLKDSLNQVLKAAVENLEFKTNHFPVFVPISAENAFLYRTAHGLSYDAFKKLDQQLVHKIGRNEVAPSKWKRLTKERKFEVAFAAVSDEGEYNDHLESTNFDTFLKVLGYAIGGQETQKLIIRNQLDVALSGLTWERPLAAQLLGIYEKCKVVGHVNGDLVGTFTRYYQQHREAALKEFKSTMNLKEMISAMDQLTDFVESVNLKKLGSEISDDWKASESNIINMMKGLVQDQISCIIEKMSVWSIEHASFIKCKAYAEDTDDTDDDCWVDEDGNEQPQPPTKSRPCPESPFWWKKVQGKEWKNDITGKESISSKRPGLPPVTWGTLSPHDWHVIIGSVLLLSFDKNFITNFGPLKICLDTLYSKAGNYWIDDIKCSCAANSEIGLCENCDSGDNKRKYSARLNRYLNGNYVDGVFNPTDEFKYPLVVQLTTPDSLEDPDHFGQLAWKFCQFMERRESV